MENELLAFAAIGGSILDALVLLFLERHHRRAVSATIGLSGERYPGVIWKVVGKLLEPGLEEVPGGNGTVDTSDSGVIWFTTREGSR
jgi:hypothetical protein